MIVDDHPKEVMKERVSGLIGHHHLKGRSIDLRDTL
jgi:hypothetical protein